MSTPGVPIISAMGGSGTNDDLVSASPALQQLFSQTGGPAGAQNVDALGAQSPNIGQMLSMLSPGGGLNPAQAAQFGPMFALLMGLQGGGQ